MLAPWTLFPAILFLTQVTPSVTPIKSPSYSVRLPPIQQEGLASFYGAGEQGMHGRRTATGELFESEDLTCASRTLPLNSVVIVEDVTTGNWTYCRVNDRGPFGMRLYDLAGGGWAAVIKRKRGYEVKRREGGRWLKSEWYDARPGEYRGIMDMSYGTAKALGVDLDRGLNKIRIRYWGSNPREGYSPLVTFTPSYPEECPVEGQWCSSP